VKITALTDGPLVVEGPLELVDQRGKPYAPRNALKFALCRCGGSSRKPFCDGSHSRNGFICPAQPEGPAAVPA
jgi:CDGSH-type Zn-finger protein